MAQQTRQLLHVWTRRVVEHVPLPKSLSRGSTIAAVGAAGAALVWVVYSTRKASSGKEKAKNGPRAAPDVPDSTWTQVAKLSGGQAPFNLLAYARQMGSSVFRLNLGVVKAYVITGAEIADFLALPPMDKPQITYAKLNGFTGGPNILTLNGHEWSHRRKGVAHAFSDKHIKRMGRICVDHMTRWCGEVGDEAEFDIADEMLKLTFAMIIETSFDYELTDKEAQEFLTNMELGTAEYFGQTSDFARFFRHSVAWWFLPSVRRADRAVLDMRRSCMDMIQKWRQKTTPTEGTILAGILGNKSYKDDEERISDMILLLLGGHDTTAYSISWILYFLAKHPDELKILQMALDRADPTAHPKTVPELVRVVTEAMRLMPSAALGGARLTNQDFVAGDILVPKKSLVFCCPYIFQRSANVFERPDDFIPSRWESPTTDMTKCFAPFLRGSRNCVGQSLAKEETYQCAAMIVQKFDLEILTESPPTFCVTIKPVDTRLRIRRRQGLSC